MQSLQVCFQQPGSVTGTYYLPSSNWSPDADSNDETVFRIDQIGGLWQGETNAGHGKPLQRKFGDVSDVRSGPLIVAAGLRIWGFEHVGDESNPFYGLSTSGFM